MKIISLLPIFILLGLFTSQMLAQGLVKVTGHIEGVGDCPEAKFAKVIYLEYGFFGSKSAVEQVVENGDFEITFQLDQAHDFYFEFGENMLQLFAKPGDSIFLAFRCKDFIDAETPERMVTISGSEVAMNRLLLAYLPAFMHAFNDYDFQGKQRDSLEWQAYLSWRQQRAAEEHSFLKKWIKENEVQHENFEHWADASIIYRAAKEMLDYNILRQIKMKYSPEAILPEAFFQFLDTILIDNPSAGISTDYGRAFMNSLQANLLPNLRKDTAYMVLSKSDRSAAFLYRLKQKAEKTTGFARDAVLTEQLSQAMDMQNSAATVAPSLDYYFQVVGDEYMKQRVAERYLELVNGKTIDIAEEVAAMGIADSSANVLPGILEKHRGKVIFLGFWEVWCGPCLGELSRGFPTFIPKFDADKVAFVFLAGRSPKDLWVKKTEEFAFPSEQIFLTPNQFSVIDKLLKVTGVPRHVVIDKTGKITELNAPGPGEQLEKVIAALMEKE